jgi:hypothetical protein
MGQGAREECQQRPRLAQMRLVCRRDGGLHSMALQVLSGPDGGAERGAVGDSQQAPRGSQRRLPQLNYMAGRTMIEIDGVL